MSDTTIDSPLTENKSKKGKTNIDTQTGSLRKGNTMRICKLFPIANDRAGFTAVGALGHIICGDPTVQYISWAILRHF